MTEITEFQLCNRSQALDRLRKDTGILPFCPSINNEYARIILCIWLLIFIV